MSQLSKCPKVADVLSYWEALGEVSEPSYKSLLYFSSIGSYCRWSETVHKGAQRNEKKTLTLCQIKLIY